MAVLPLRIVLALIALSLPLSASAYLLPEDVLENNQYLLPPTHTEAPGRVRKQQKVSAERRAREQETYFAAQRPEPPQEEDFTRDDEEVSDAEILRTARLLDRIEKKQLEIYSPSVLRGRAPMVDTGPATLLMAIPFLAAAGWTWRKAGRMGEDKK
ncbi:hypothetical protein A3E47_02520 [Candidatus Peribacteria bacterium RIFCSPHIGHO2_12_FULL_54_10]|nr:MAG: hypothetical protein A3E47_02520 [Candidatus Peribacteria bacterium RIFCSPHIGHO2_12_FULL_54_10]